MTLWCEDLLIALAWNIRLKSWSCISDRELVDTDMTHFLDSLSATGSCRLSPFNWSKS